MRDIVVEKALQKILKKLLLVVIGSGLITNALYIYGLSYYQGYINNLGFDYNFFPVEWKDALLWTYFASRELGASTVSFWTKITGPVVLLILVVSYFIARMWMAISASEQKRGVRRKKNITFARYLVRVRKNNPRFFGITYPPIRWLLIMEQSVWAFLASYFVLIVLFFIPLFIAIWVYFPLIGIKHGENIGTSQYELYQSSLCSRDGGYWIKCVELSTAHLNDNNLPDVVYGKVIARSGMLIGLLTKDGPVTMTMPPLFFQLTEKSGLNKDESEMKSAYDESIKSHDEGSVE